MNGWQQAAVWLWGFTLGAVVIHAWVQTHYRTRAEEARAEQGTVTMRGDEE